MRNKNKSAQRSLCFHFVPTEYTKYQSVSSHKSHTQENIINQLPLSAMQKVLVSCVLLLPQTKGMEFHLWCCVKFKKRERNKNTHAATQQQQFLCGEKQPESLWIMHKHAV